MPTTFIGLDLAWTRNHESGIACLEYKANKLILKEVVCKQTDEEILNFIHDHQNESKTIIAIDAPLIIKEDTGTRKAESEFSKEFGKYRLGIFSSNKKFMLYQMPKIISFF